MTVAVSPALAGASLTAVTASVAVYDDAELPVPSFTVKVKVAYVAPFAFAAGSHVNFARLAVVIVSPFETAASSPVISPSSAVPAPAPLSSQSVPADAACRVAETIVSLSTSAYPNSEAAKTCELSSLTVTVKSAAVGRS